jgi:hypothetical protein
MTSSATERELEKGELKTGIPALAAEVRSTWFVPIQKQPMTISWRKGCVNSQDDRPTTLGRTFDADLSTLSVIFVLLRMPMT